MCTVSYIPQKNNGGFVLTSNRDEKSFRSTKAPKIYTIEDTKICFPKDERAGGSWIAASENGRLCCLLNGAFVAHKKKAFYGQSRGEILTELAASNLKPIDCFHQKQLLEIEPFTIVTIEKKEEQIYCFSEFIWDGNHAHYQELDPNKSYIWSSATLYSAKHRNIRKQWFNQFLKEINGNLSAENIYDFHSGTHTNDNSINVVMERNGGLKTVSITQVFLGKENFMMKYFDLHNSINTAISI